MDNPVFEFKKPEAKFKEFEPRLKYGWFHLKLYSIFQDFKIKPALNWNRFLGHFVLILNLQCDTWNMTVARRLEGLLWTLNLFVTFSRQF